MFFLVGVPVLLLVVPPSYKAIMISTILFICLSIIFRHNRYRIFGAIDNPKSTFALASLLGLSFYIKWLPSSKVALVSSKLAMSSSTLLLLSAVVLAILSIRGIDLMIDFIKRSCIADVDSLAPASNLNISLQDGALLFINSIIVITLCSKCSPLFPLNDWVDSNAFFTVGKSMLSGLVPYKDLFEHKGPLLYFLHAAAAYFSYNSFIFIYFVEIICCFFFSLFSYKIVRYFTSDSLCLPSMVVMIDLLYTSTSFVLGDSVEEFCLPMLAYALYATIRVIPGQGMPRSIGSFVIGVFAGWVLWTKFTILGFFIGLLVIPAYTSVSKGNVKGLFIGISAAAAGVFAATLPCLVYFGTNDAIADWFGVYIYDNLFLYSYSNAFPFPLSILANLCTGINNLISSNIVALTLMVIGYSSIRHFFYRKMTAVHLYITTALCFIFIYIGGRAYPYYALIFSVFAPIGILAIPKGLFRRLSLNHVKLAVLSFVIILAASPNIFSVIYREKDLPQFQISADIAKFGIDSPTLLNYGFMDGGFYTVSKIVPTCKYFFVSNLPLEDVAKQQRECVRSGAVDFVVTDCIIEDLIEYALFSSYSSPYDEKEYYLYVLKKYVSRAI